MKKINSEYKITLDNSPFSVVMGTSNKKNPEVIYTILSTYISPLTDEFDDDSYNEIEKSIKKYVRNILSQNNVCERDAIVVCDIALNRVFVGKQSFLDVQIYFKPTKNTIESKKRNFKDISKTIYDVYVKDIIEFAEKLLNNHDLELSKDKHKIVKEAIY